MAIELGKFKEKAAAAQAEKAAKERAEAERSQAEKEAKGNELETINKELQAVKHELAAARASLDEADEFAEKELKTLAPEDQEAFRAQVAEEKTRAESLWQQIKVLAARKDAMDPDVIEFSSE